MSDTHHSPQDLSTLVWVQDELRGSLEAAHKALRRFLKEAQASSVSDIEAIDPVHLRTALQHIHQGVGALELVGWPLVAQVLRASELAVQRFSAKPQKVTSQEIDTIEKASFALLDYLQRLVVGKSISTLALFPVYRAVLVVAAADRIHPADLWHFDWRWRDVVLDGPVTQPATQAADAQAQGLMESLMLLLMRDQLVPAAQQLRDLCASLAAGATNLPCATLWKLACGFFEALAGELLHTDVFNKRVVARLLAQLRVFERGQSEVSERLAQDLLFFCAQSVGPRVSALQTPYLHAVLRTYELHGYQPVNYESSSLGQFDPAAVVQAKKRVANAKDAWSGVAGGEMHRLSALSEQFSLVGESLKRFYPHGEVLAQALNAAVAQTQKSGTPPSASLAMEVATSVLYLESSLEDLDFDHPEQAHRVQRLAQRVAEVQGGQTPDPLEVWMEELYRRVSDRQTMGSVVQELRASLTETEKHIDQYFRDPQSIDALAPVPSQLGSIRGVMSVLGLDQAVQALARMRDDVDVLMAAQPQADAALNADQPLVVDRLAGNLGALGFLIDMLAAQPHVAKSLFVFNAQSGVLSPLMGRSHAAQQNAGFLANPIEPELVEQAQALSQAAASDQMPLDALSRDLDRLFQEAQQADQPVLVATVTQAQAAIEKASDVVEVQEARDQLAQALSEFVATASEPMALEPLPMPVPPPLVLGPTSQATDLADDPEMREIFLEEALEKVVEARAALSQLEQLPQDVESLTCVRRAFHTLKGSSRMVGLTQFGDAAWSCEQLYNAWLASSQGASPELLAFSCHALDYLDQWIQAIAQEQAQNYQAAPLVDAAAAFGRGEKVGVIAAAPVAELEPDPVLPPVELKLPEFAPDFDLNLDIPPAPTTQPVDIDFDQFVLQEDVAAVEPAMTVPQPLATPEVFADVPVLPLAEEDPVKWVGPLRISLPLFNIYLNEADELSRQLMGEVAEWAMEIHLPVTESMVSFAHSLAGSSATVGFADLSALSRSFEHALARSQAIGQGTPQEGRLFVQVAEEIRRLLHQFAAGFLVSPEPTLLQRLAEHEITSVHRLQELSHSVRGELDEAKEVDFELPIVAPEDFHFGDISLDLPVKDTAHDLIPVAEPEPPSTSESTTKFGVPLEPEALGLPELKAFTPLDATTHGAPVLPSHVEGSWHARDVDDDIDAVDVVDAELFPIFEEEAQELLPALDQSLRLWVEKPADQTLAFACMRTLHTLKGGARLAGAMRLGELAHRLETAIEGLLAKDQIQVSDLEPLQTSSDKLGRTFEALRVRDATAYAQAQEQALAQQALPTAPPDTPVLVPTALPVLESLPVSAVPVSEAQTPSKEASTASTEIDWSRFVRPDELAQAIGHAPHLGASNSVVRVRGSLLERMVNQAGELSITRARIEGEIGHIRFSLKDLTENLERLRQQLRDIELQAETQMISRQEAARAAHEVFDPLESDRFTRFQELTRMMAESVNDVATVQRALQRTLETTEDELAAQARLARNLQDDLLRTRMVEFDSLSDRLYRVVRQAAKETAKQVRLDLIGGSIEVDRGVLDRMTPSFEHLLRNCVTHGIESPQARGTAGKDATGSVVVSLRQEGNEVEVEFRDDGAGLNLARIQEKGQRMGLLQAGQAYNDAELANLIFMPGFSTAETVTELAGRGVGMDVVRSEVNAMGGRIETATATGQGTSFKLVLPLTTAVTQVVMLRCGDRVVAVPAILIEIVRRAKPQELEAAYESASYPYLDRSLLFFWLGSLLQHSPVSQETGRTYTVVVARSAQQRIALHVDEVLGTQEVVVKNLGPQLSRLPGLAGMTLLASGTVALIYNPVALATLYGDTAKQTTALARQASTSVSTLLPSASTRDVVQAAPLVLVVDDSLTVRRVTQRLLVREGFRVALAKDGIDALEKLADERPQVVLSDIEMPRMDGFDLARNIRSDARWRDLPIIMITSRIAQKHRDHATELGVDHYLGKPYSEEDLLGLIARYTVVTDEASAQRS